MNGKVFRLKSPQVKTPSGCPLLTLETYNTNVVSILCAGVHVTVLEHFQNSYMTHPRLRLFVLHEGQFCWLHSVPSHEIEEV